jgi:endonuclease/exonuclease/phosphatase family metal-dependent hydrolase
MRAMLFAFLLTPFAMSAASLGGAAQAAEPLNVKLMTFNIRYKNAKDGPNGWALRREMAADVVRRFDGDFVNVQEAMPDQIADLRKMLPEYRIVGRTRESDPKRGESVLILYRDKRWRLDEERHGVFWLSDTPAKPGSMTWGNTLPRIVTWGRFVDRKTGRAVYVFNTHLDNASEPARKKSAVLLAQRIADRDPRDPVLVAGDFNVGESSDVLAHLTGRATQSPVKLIDTFRAAHPNDKRVGTFHAFHGGNGDGEKIDFILASPGVKVVSAEIIRKHRKDRYPSDHYPVTAELTLP